MITENRLNNVPTTKVQQQFWIMNQFFPDSPVYNIPSVFIIKGDLKIDALETGLNEIIRRHSVFRTIFSAVDGASFQVIDTDHEHSIQFIDLTQTGADERDREVQKIVREEVSRKFDLTKGPLITSLVVQTGPDEYLLCITMHHIIVDLHTKNLFALELSEIYNAAVKGESLRLPEPEFQYADFAQQEQAFIESPAFDIMIGKWQAKLDKHDGVLEFPADKKRPAVQSVNGSALPVGLNERQADLVRNLSAVFSVSPFVVLLAAFYVLLYIYTRKHELVIGVPLTNRKKSEYKNIMGCFMNILPLGIEIDPSAPFQSVVVSVRKSMLEGHRIQEVPFEEIVRRLLPRRNPALNPFFQFGFTFEPPMRLELEGLEVTSLPVHTGGAQLDMFMTLWEEGNVYSGRIEYNSDLFDVRSVEYFSDNYLLFLEKMEHDYMKPVIDVAFLDRGFYNRISDNRLNAEFTHFNNSHSIHSLIEEQVAKTPDRVAAVFGDTQVTYRELNERANKLAAYILSVTGGDQQLVGIHIKRSLEMLVAILGIYKSGSAYVPLDPDFPGSRLEYMIDHSDISFICTQQELGRVFAHKKTTAICLDSDWDTIDKFSGRDPEVPVSADSPAYVMYTSGSTGTPKGVRITHKSVVNFLVSMSKVPGITEDDVLLAITTISFDISVLELLLPLIAGARVVIAAKEATIDGTLLLGAIEKYQPTFMQATPITWHILFAAGWKGTAPFTALCGGEAMPREIADKLVSAVPNVWNMYGPTETTVWSTCYRLSEKGQPVLIGKPIDNTSIYIVDENMRRVPVGVPGEVYIGGDGVASGYFNRPDLTAERFVANPFKENTGDVLYRTGDSARLLFDGNYEFFSRIDTQVKIHGFRIELSEIDNTITAYESVTEAVTIVREDDFSKKHIIAYLVSDNSAFDDISGLREFLHNRLPHYMVPSHYKILDRLPMTPNGKIDRKALPDFDLRVSDFKRDIVAPVSSIEKTICGIWQQVLRFEEVSVNDNFFEIGGNSISSIEVVRLVNEQLHRQITVMDIFEYPSVAAMAKYLGAGQDDADKINSIKDRASRQKMAMKQRLKKR